MSPLADFLLHAEMVVVFARAGKLFHAGRTWAQLHEKALKLHETHALDVTIPAFKLVWALDRALEER